MESNKRIDISDVTDVHIFDAASLLNSARNEAYKKFRQAVEDIKVIRKSFSTVCATSWGKDSLVTLLAALNAHIELMQEGVLHRNSPFIVTHIDTGVESHIMQILAKSEMKKLTQFCSDFGINLDLQIGHPSLSNQWASLYCSGLKLISTASANADCAVQLKINNAAQIEKIVEEKYDHKVITLLGSRLDESQRRKSNMRKRGTDKTTVDMLIAGNSEQERVFAPIMDMTTDEVWTIIRAAGRSPMTDMGFEIMSYNVNHRLINIVYQDGADSSCQYSAKKVKGDKTKAGGCGTSPRFGCSLCAKALMDLSGEQIMKQPKHSVIGGNILQVRNYILSVAQDIHFRTWHGKAVDHTTGAIALQPNVLKSEVIEKIIWLLSQATADDFARAKHFTALVKDGREIEDPGYADIINDTSMEAEDRNILAAAYKEFAQQHLIKPMSLDIALYLSAIHARDGVRLPPFRALWIWNEVANGARIPYPQVKLDDVTMSDIPDAVMALPDSNIPYPSINEFSFLTTETDESCEISTSQVATKIPVRDAKYFVCEDELAGLKNSDMISIRGLSCETLTHKLRVNPLQHEPVKKFSKRPIKRVSKKGGQYTVLERGRTSLDSPSFSYRTSTPNLAKNALIDIPLYLQSEQRSHTLNVAPDNDLQASYGINIEHLYAWIDFGGLESALKAHDDAVRINTKHDGHHYFYGGISPFQHFIRWGVLSLSEKALINTKRILQRTAYFARLGLFSLPEEAIVTLAKKDDYKGAQSVSEYRNVPPSITLGIDKILNMAAYRQYKASVIAKIRVTRNENRRTIKQQLSNQLACPLTHAKDVLHQIYATCEHPYRTAYVKVILAQTLLDDGCKQFDTTNYQHSFMLNKGSLAYIRAFFTDIVMMKKLFDKALHTELFETTSNRKSLVDEAKLLLEKLDGIEKEVMNMMNDPVQRAQLGYKEVMLLDYRKITKLSTIPAWPKANAFKVTFGLNRSIDIKTAVW